MTFHVRSEWTTRHLAGIGTPASRGVEAAVVHHSVGRYTGGDKAAWLRNLEAYSIRKGLSAVDYNELIFPDGDVWEGRGLAWEDGATYRFNSRSASWCLIGNFDQEQVPGVMLDALARRIREATAAGWLAPDRQILGHGQVGTFATACPGRFCLSRIGEVRALVLTGGSATPATPAPKKKGKRMQLIVNPELAGDTWFVTDGIHKRPLGSGEPQVLNDLGIITPERNAEGEIVPKWCPNDVFERLQTV